MTFVMTNIMEEAYEASPGGDGGAGRRRRGDRLLPGSRPLRRGREDDDGVDRRPGRVLHQQVHAEELRRPPAQPQGVRPALPVPLHQPVAGAHRRVHGRPPHHTRRQGQELHLPHPRRGGPGGVDQGHGDEGRPGDQDAARSRTRRPRPSAPAASTSTSMHGRLPQGSYDTIKQVHAVALATDILEQQGAWYYFGERQAGRAGRRCWPTCRPTPCSWRPWRTGASTPARGAAGGHRYDAAPKKRTVARTP